jgi:hypothetical protein
MAAVTKKPRLSETISEPPAASVSTLPEPVVEPELLEEEKLSEIKPLLIPPWVRRLPEIAGALMLGFAAIAVVVERHELRYHSAPPVEKS